MAGKSCGRSCGIGGQAVLEGVMMKNQEKCAVAIRKANDQIEVKEMDYKAFASKSKIFQIPFVRGFFNFLDSLVLGTNA